MWIMWIKKSSRKTSFCEKRTKVRKYKDSQLFDIKMWISLDKDIFIKISEYNANEIIKYLFERYPY